MLGRDLMARLALGHSVEGRDRDEFDITSAEECRRIIDETVPDAVINAAAYTEVDGAETNRDLCYAVNADGVGHLVAACAGKHIKLVHISTDYVFDGTGKKPYTEEDPPQPQNVYGRSKAAGEQAILNGGAPFLLIRTAWLYGRHGKNFVTTILQKAKTTGALSVVDDQFGTPTFTWDLSGAIEVLLSMNAQGIFHVTNRGICTWHAFASKILQYAGLSHVSLTPISSDTLDRPARRPAYSGLSNGKFQETTAKPCGSGRWPSVTSSVTWVPITADGRQQPPRRRSAKKGTNRCEPACLLVSFSAFQDRRVHNGSWQGGTMKTKLGVFTGAVACLLFLAGGVGFCGDETKVNLKDWTAIIESKVAEPIVIRVSSTTKISTSRSWPSLPAERYFGKPQARPLCLRAAKVVAMRDMIEMIEGVRVDSETVVKDYVVASDTIQATVNGIARNVTPVGEPNYMPDGTCEVRYRMSLRGPFMIPSFPGSSPTTGKPAHLRRP